MITQENCLPPCSYTICNYLSLSIYTVYICTYYVYNGTTRGHVILCLIKVLFFFSTGSDIPMGEEMDTVSLLRNVTGK